MIFVTTGTTKHPFRAMDFLVDELKRRFNEKIIYQNATVEFSFDEFVALLKRARVVVTHGGPATLFLIGKYAKHLPVVFPRGCDSHVDNHQQFFVASVADKIGYLVQEPFEISQALESYVLQPKKNVVHAVDYTTSLVTHLDRWIRGL